MEGDPSVPLHLLSLSYHSFPDHLPSRPSINLCAARPSSPSSNLSLCPFTCIVHCACHPLCLSSTISVAHQASRPPCPSSNISVAHRTCRPIYMSSNIHIVQYTCRPINVPSGKAAIKYPDSVRAPAVQYSCQTAVSRFEPISPSPSCHVSRPCQTPRINRRIYPIRPLCLYRLLCHNTRLHLQTALRSISTPFKFNAFAPAHRPARNCALMSLSSIAHIASPTAHLPSPISRRPPPVAHLPSPPSRCHPLLVTVRSHKRRSPFALIPHSNSCFRPFPSLSLLSLHPTGQPPCWPPPTASRRPALTF